MTDCINCWRPAAQECGPHSASYCSVHWAEHQADKHSLALGVGAIRFTDEAPTLIITIMVWVCTCGGYFLMPQLNVEPTPAWLRSHACYQCFTKRRLGQDCPHPHQIARVVKHEATIDLAVSLTGSADNADSVGLRPEFSKAWVCLCQNYYPLYPSESWPPTGWIGNHNCFQCVYQSPMGCEHTHGHRETVPYERALLKVVTP